MHEIYIPDWQPTRLNQLMNVHWSKAGRMKKSDVSMISAYSQSVPKARGKRRVELIIEMAPRQRCADVDAHWKSTLDALVKCKLLIDDNQKHCEIMPVKFVRGARKSTTIILHE